MTNPATITRAELREEIARRGLEIYQVQHMTGLHYTTVQGLVTGKARTGDKSVLAIAAALSIQAEAVAPDEEPVGAPRGRKEYLIVIRSHGVDAEILRSRKFPEVRKKYVEMLNADRFPRLIINGEDVPILAADRMMFRLPKEGAKTVNLRRIHLPATK